MIDRMVGEYERMLERLYRLNPDITQDESVTTKLRRQLSALNENWGREFARRARPLADDMVGRVDKFAKKNLGASLREMSGGLTIKTPEMPAALYDKMLASIANNVSLIKSIPLQYHERIQGIALRSIQSGGQGSSQIFEEIMRQGQVTKGRAKLIAEDQTRKITKAINEERMKSAGLDTFEWVHSGGGAEPRKLHVEYDGKQFSLNEPPIIDERTRQRGLPGELIKCRCRMRPVVNFTKYLE